MSATKRPKGLTLEIRQFAHREMLQLHEKRQSGWMARPRTEMADLDNEDYVTVKASSENKFGEGISPLFTPYKARMLVKHGPDKPLTSNVSAKSTERQIDQIAQNVAKREAVTRREDEEARSLLEAQEEADNIKARVSDFVRVIRESEAFIDNNRTVDFNTPAVQDAEDLMSRMKALSAAVDDVSRSTEVSLQRVQLVEQMRLLANLCLVHEFAENYLLNHKSFHEKLLEAPLPIAAEKIKKRKASSDAGEQPAALSRLSVNNMNQDVKRALVKNSDRMKGIVTKLDTIRESRESGQHKKKDQTKKRKQTTVAEEGTTLEEVANLIDLKVNALCQDLMKYKSLLIASDSPIIKRSSFFGFVTAPGVSEIKFFTEGPLKKSKEAKILTDLIDAFLNDGTEAPAESNQPIEKKVNYTVNKVALSSSSSSPHIRVLELANKERNDNDEEGDEDYTGESSSDSGSYSVSSSVVSERYDACAFCQLEWTPENDKPETPWKGCVEECDEWYCSKCAKHFDAHEKKCEKANKLLSMSTI